ncbi:hypothetical protein AL542_00930 [Grimontia hollisae]|nr:hypothetical protein AL542_00930 [Grimontia hollisae]
MFIIFYFSATNLTGKRFRFYFACSQYDQLKCLINEMQHIETMLNVGLISQNKHELLFMFVI